MAEDLARVRVRGTDDTKGAFDSIRRSVVELDGAFGKLKGVLAGLGVGLSAGGFALFVRSIVSAQAALDDLSERTSLTVETLSSLQQIAHIGGQNLDDIASMASRYAKSVAEAAGGNKELLASFQALGISQEDLRSKKFDELFVEFGRKIAGATNQTYAIAYATQLAGKSAANAMPFFKDLAEEGLKAARVTAEQAAAAEKLEKEWHRLTDAWQASKNELATGLVPWMTRLVEQMREAMRLGGGVRGLWEFAGQIGGHPWRTPGESVANMQSAIGNFEREREDALRRNDRERAADMDRMIADTRRQLEFARFRQRQDALALLDESSLDANDLRMRAARRGGYILPPPPQANRSDESERARSAREYAAAFEKSAEMEREAWSFVPKLEEAMKERERWENMYGLEITMGKTNEEMREFHKNLLGGIDSMREIEEINMRLAAGFDEHGNALKRNAELAQEFGLVFSSAASDAFRNWQGVRHLLKAIVTDMAQVLFQATVSRPLGSAIANAFAGAFGGAAGGGTTPIAQHGLDFKVGGSGGPDTQLVRFWATPGERVTVETPEQQRAGRGSTFYVDMRGASVEAVARLEAFVARVNGSIEQRAVAAVFDRNVRGVRA